MWNAQGKDNASGQMVRYDGTKSDAGMPMANSNRQSIGSGFSDLYVEDVTGKRNAEVLHWSSSVQDAPSSMQRMNYNVNQPCSFVQTPATFDGNSGRSHFSHSQTNGFFGNPILQSAQENTFTSQSGTDPIYSQAFDFNFQKGATTNPMSESFPQKETSSTNNAAIVEIPRLPYSQHFTYNVAGSREVNNSQFSTSATGGSGNFQGGFILRDDMNQKYSALFRGGNMPTDSSVLTFKEPVRARISTNEPLSGSANPDKKPHIEDYDKTGSTDEHAKHANILDFTRSINALLCQTNFIVNSVSAAERGDNGVPSTNEITPTYDLSARMPSEPTVGVPKGISGTVNIPANGQDQDSINNMDIHRCHGIKDYNILTGHNNQPTVQSGSLDGQPNVSFDREIKARNGNPNSTVAAKIWDGTIQLNTSTTIAAVAFFKSGEKALELNWPHFIEVKGKVRLEAFEKFIQELPRSRSRALMVTSICWKVGTSETGLAGIKEVGKGYKESLRVGFANLCTGTDLYVCPRTETIITILAKYGFFKGMAVVEEDQDSLIGCVVWRRNQNMNAVLKDPDSKKTHPDKILDSPSESGLNAVPINATSTETQDQENIPTIVQKADTALAPLAQVDPVIAPPVIAPSSQTLPVPRVSESVSQTQMIPSSMNQTLVVPYGANLLSTGVNVIPVSVEPLKTNQNIPIIPSQLSFNNYPSSLQQRFTAVSSTEEAALSPVTAPKKPRIDAGDQQPTFSGAALLPHGAQVRGKGADDDDLPEFDFNTACGPAISVVRPPWPNQQGFVSTGQNARHTPPESSHQGFMVAGQNVVPIPPGDGGASAQTARPVAKSEVASVHAPFQQGFVSTGQDARHTPPESSHQCFMLAGQNVVPIPPGDGGASAQTARPVAKSEVASVQAPFHAVPAHVHAGIPLHANVVAGNSDRNGAGQMEEKSHNPAVRENQVQPNMYPKRALWDDDDMPEWCPPDIGQVHAQTLPQAPPPPPPPPLLPHHPPEFHRQRQLPPPPPPPPLLRMSAAVHATGLPYSVSNHTSELLFRAPFPSNAAEHGRGLLGQEPAGQILALPPPRASSPNYQLERRQSPGRTFSSAARHLHGFDVKHERRPLEPDHNETSRRQHAQFYRREHSPRERPGDAQFYRRERSPRERPGDAQFYRREEQSPRQRPSESSRRRSRGFDVSPRRSRTPPRRTRRRPSLFDVKPDSYQSPGRR